MENTTEWDCVQRRANLFLLQDAHRLRQFWRLVFRFFYRSKSVGNRLSDMSEPKLFNRQRADRNVSLLVALDKMRFDSLTQVVIREAGRKRHRLLLTEPTTDIEVSALKIR
jgi:hypothetical protein